MIARVCFPKAQKRTANFAVRFCAVSIMLFYRRPLHRSFFFINVGAF